MKPFTIEHFRRYAETLVLDTGETWQVEDFQLEVFEPILAGFREVWAILPEGNTKSTMMAGFALYHCDYTYSPWVPIGASSRDQAEIMFGQAAEIVYQTPGLTQRFKVQNGYRRILSLRNGGRGIRVYPADVKTGDGVIPTLAMCDEGHRWPDLSLYRLWKGKLNKRKGQIIMISTAGAPGEEFEETRDAIRTRCKNVVVTGGRLKAQGSNIVLNEWRVGDPSLITDMEAVKEANPFSGITEETLFEEFDSPTTDLGDWKRLKCNIPSRSVLAAVTEVEWANALALDEDGNPVGIPEGERIDIGMDVAWKHDTFAMVPFWIGPEYRLLGKPVVLEPPRDGSTMHPDEVKRGFESIMVVNPIDDVVIDLERAEDIAAWLEDECAVRVIDRPQGNANAVEDYDAFMKGLRNGTLKHTGDPTLKKHVMNAIARNLPGDKKRFDRPSQSRAKKRQSVRVIDALTGAAMVNHHAGEFRTDGGPMVAWR